MSLNLVISNRFSPDSVKDALKISIPWGSDTMTAEDIAVKLNDIFPISEIENMFVLHQGNWLAWDGLSIPVTNLLVTKKQLIYEVMPRVVMSAKHRNSISENLAVHAPLNNDMGLFYTENPFEEKLALVLEGYRELKVELQSVNWRVDRLSNFISRNRTESTWGHPCQLCGSDKVHPDLPANCTCSTPSLCRACWAGLVPQKENSTLVIKCPYCRATVAEHRDNADGAIFRRPAPTSGIASVLSHSTI